MTQYTHTNKIPRTHICRQQHVTPQTSPDLFPLRKLPSFDGERSKLIASNPPTKRQRQRRRDQRRPHFSFLRPIMLLLLRSCSSSSLYSIDLNDISLYLLILFSFLSLSYSFSVFNHTPNLSLFSVLYQKQTTMALLFPYRHCIMAALIVR